MIDFCLTFDSKCIFFNHLGDNMTVVVGSHVQQ